ncbi:MLP-like protein 328 [Cucumis melo var. makuwa]|uniref:MLP-like protein 328 n=1 Tax=Cucumis melo var. makuwa TaxID=1194695 RepID=A0A5D3C7D7_CUCMM|nr:MLP-like protein 328 [Cucumis melo var. makuwa]TYK06249.1 MLP-like protein 328 [Cucumis melo var. makuwa]
MFKFMTGIGANMVMVPSSFGTILLVRINNLVASTMETAEVVKERVEFDDKKLVIRIVGLEGDVFEHYKTFIGTYQVIPKGPNRSGIIFTLEYEKLRDGPPYPQKYHEAMNSLAKDIEAHLK